MKNDRDTINAEIGKRMAARRIEMGLSQTEVAKACGVTFQQVQKYENGRDSPTMERLYKIAGRLEVSVPYLFGAAAPEDAGQPSSPDVKISNRERLEAMKAYGGIREQRVRSLLSDLMRAIASDQ